MAQSHQVQKLELQVEVLKSLLNDGSREQLNADLEAWAQKLREEALRTPQWRPDNSDPFSFSATIIRAHEEESEHTVARGRLDSGCDEDWISTEILERAGLKPEIKAIEIPMTYTAFSGQSFKPIGTIDIKWYAVNAGLSRKTTFLVHDAVPFDMVLGKVFIKEESIFVFNKPALALRQGRFTKGTPFYLKFPQKTLTYITQRNSAKSKSTPVTKVPPTNKSPPSDALTKKAPARDFGSRKLPPDSRPQEPCLRIRI
jgi:hypothetical protein